MMVYAPGDYFGELALLSDEPRRATVAAGAAGCRVACLDRGGFVRLLGPLRAAMEAEGQTKYGRVSTASVTTSSNSAAHQIAVEE